MRSLRATGLAIAQNPEIGAATHSVRELTLAATSPIKGEENRSRLERNLVIQILREAFTWTVADAFGAGFGAE